MANGEGAGAPLLEEGCAADATGDARVTWVGDTGSKGGHQRSLPAHRKTKTKHSLPMLRAELSKPGFRERWACFDDKMLRGEHMGRNRHCLAGRAVD